MDITSNKKQRIAKVLARAGLCSRREAERWIYEGRVSVNNEVIKTPALWVQSEDHISVNGNVLPEKVSTKLWRYYKPVGLVTTHNDPEGRPTVFESLPKGLPRMISVGRLDLNSEGLLLFSNDGELTRKLELPKNSLARRYRVRVFGKIDESSLMHLEKGVVLNGFHYGSVLAVCDSKKGSNAWLTVEIKEGKNREIRKILQHLGLEVNRLIRVSYGPFDLKGLACGELKEVPPKTLNHQIKKLCFR